MIEVRDLVKRYGATVAVDGVSFEVDKGEILGFLGPNGAGKTTTMKMLTCFISSDGGSCSVAGHDTFSEPLEAQRRIGYLPESTPLYVEMGIVEYLEFVCELRGVKGEKRRERIAEIVDVCGLKPMITKTIGELSKGYRQRVGLAQAMVHDPDILILDEPTSGLDPNQIVEIRSLIKKIGREKTIVLSTHILSEVTSTCDRAIIINKGRLVAGGTPEELQNRGSGGVLLTTIRGPEGEVAQALGAIDGVLGISSANGRYELKMKKDVDPSEAVFRLAVDRGWTLTELHFEAASLEDVFRELTIGDTAA